MPDYVVSRFAQSDLQDIVRYTAIRWSADQARRYIAELRTCFQKLAEFPEIGRACDEVKAGLRRHESGSHVVFYRFRPGGIRILRVLHGQMASNSERFER